MNGYQMHSPSGLPGLNGDNSGLNCLRCSCLCTRYTCFALWDFFFSEQSRDWNKSNFRKESESSQRLCRRAVDQMWTGCSAGLGGGWSSASWAQQHLLRGGTDKLRLSSQAGSAHMWNGISQGHQAAETCSESSATQVSFPVYILPQAPSQRFSQGMLRVLLWLCPWYLYLSETLLSCSGKHWHTQLHPLVLLLHFLVMSLSCSESRFAESALPFLFFSNAERM